MTIIPTFVQRVVQAHPDSLLYWFSQEMYQRLLGWAQRDFLVQVQAHLDFGLLERACADYHHSSGPGAPVVHSVARLVRALVVKSLLNLSLRDLEHEIQWNLLVKWFVGYAVFETGPDHATLERFEQWVCEQRRRTFSAEILAQIDQAFPEERHKAQLGDTYAMRANAAAEGLIHFIDYQAKVNGMAFNLRQWMRELDKRSRVSATASSP